MQLEEMILGFIGNPDYTPLKPTELFTALQPSDKNAFQTTLADMLERGKLVEVKNGRLCLPEDAGMRVGRIHFRQSGSALLFTDGAPQPLEIPAEETFVAMHGDTVIASVMENPHHRRYRLGPRGKAIRDNNEPLGRVTKVLERARTRMTGTLQRSKVLWHVIPDDPRLIRNIIVADPKTSSLKPKPREGSKVVVELAQWKHRHLNPQGKIVEVLGRSHVPATEHAALFAQYGLDKDFPAAVEREAQQVSKPVSAAQAKGRLDLRAMPVFTVDPDDAKDFDDALHLERLDNGHVRIGVHIADVSSYVRPNSKLDHEAQRRGNSTYLVGEVVPMLPHSLSSGVCSLKEAEDRLTKSVLLTFDNKGNLVDSEFANTVICSTKRLTYKQAKLLMDENDLQKIRDYPQPPAHMTGFAGKPLKALTNAELRQLQSHIRQMWDIAAKLRAARLRSGSLDLDMPESKIFVDERGYPAKIERIENDESHQLIEEFMLLANESVARAFNHANLSAIHRVHDNPDPDKLDELRDELKAMDIKVGDLTNPREVGKFLKITKEHPKGVFLRTLFLRSLKQACYKAVPEGHYGLAKQHYVHFTSPIRRYADLVVHRIFENYLRKIGAPSAPATSPALYNATSLGTIAQHISLTEQNSTEAERQSVKNRLLEYFELEIAKEPKTDFVATITDVKRHGFFIELSESMAYGFVSTSALQDDFYWLDETEKALIGRKTQQRFAVGDRVRVNIVRVDRFKRQMDFTLAGRGTRPAFPTKPKPGKAQDKRKPGKPAKPKKFAKARPARPADKNPARPTKPKGQGPKKGKKAKPTSTHAGPKRKSRAPAKPKQDRKELKKLSKRSPAKRSGPPSRGLRKRK